MRFKQKAILSKQSGFFITIRKKCGGFFGCFKTSWKSTALLFYTR
ncbi:hypothetical protein HMPREF9064_0541 [Aggregatibacter segnis ATCC 33393]|uniref:Uncharacterized protein n=1 Tax=Aggregatibacter segnis ATCC 33393 TaxID=888057 RepID=E6KWJ7_9PAST|nr:hypothetical protein HMPREF9064_0541 [Aggregatibacter segnis ATCC 33393]